MPKRKAAARDLFQFRDPLPRAPRTISTFWRVPGSTKRTEYAINVVFTASKSPVILQVAIQEITKKRRRAAAKKRA